MSTALSTLPDFPAPAMDFDFPASPVGVSRQQKAAIIVRLIKNGGLDLSLTDLSEEMQQDLTMQMGSMRSVSHDVVASVVDEFINEINGIGLSFAGGLEGALNTLEGVIDSDMAERLRREGGVKRTGNPWERLIGLEVDRLLPVLEEESIEVAAVMISKLNVSKAAELLGLLPGDRARQLAYAMSLTGAVTPDAVQRIGQSLASQLDNIPPKAFDDGPVERVGAILNFSPANTRDEVLEGLDQDDRAFAKEVRKAIFTFANIAARIDPRDVPKITRGLDQAVLVTALAAAAASGLDKSSNFILDNISKRMSDGMREEMEELGKVKEADGEVAMSAVVAEIRELEAAGEVLFVAEDEEDES